MPGLFNRRDNSGASTSDNSKTNTGDIINGIRIAASLYLLYSTYKMIKTNYIVGPAPTGQGVWLVPLSIVMFGIAAVYFLIVGGKTIYNKMMAAPEPDQEAQEESSVSEVLPDSEYEYIDEDEYVAVDDDEEGAPADDDYDGDDTKEDTEESDDV